MSDLIINVIVTRLDVPKLEMMKLGNTARCTFCYGNERLSIVLYDIEGDVINIGEDKICKLAFLTGDSIVNTISTDDEFDLALANDLIAKGKVIEVLSRP